MNKFKYFILGAIVFCSLVANNTFAQATGSLDKNENPFSAGYSLFRPYSSFSGDELYRVVDPTYYGRMGFDGGVTYYSSPELTGKLVISDYGQYLSAYYFCLEKGHTYSLSSAIGSEVDTGTQTTYYWFASSGWIDTTGGFPYDFVECYTEPSFSYEEATLNLQYSQYVFLQHILYSLLLFLFLTILFVVFTNVTSGGKK